MHLTLVYFIAYIILGKVLGSAYLIHRNIKSILFDHQMNMQSNSLIYHLKEIIVCSSESNS